MSACPSCKYATTDHITLCPNCGAILDDSFATDIKQNTSNEFSGVRFWAGIVIVIIFCVYMGFLGYKSKEKYDQEQEINLAEFNLAIITEDSVKSVAVHPGSSYSKEIIRCLSKPYQDQFVKLAHKMTPAHYFGHRMERYRSIHIDAGDVGKFSLDILTSGQEVHANFSRYEDREQRLVVYYDGADLFEWLDNLPKNALQDCPALTFQ